MRRALCNEHSLRISDSTMIQFWRIERTCYKYTQYLIVVKASRKYTFQRREDSSAAEHCCVPLCSASSKFNSVLSFHSFPTDEERCKKWICNIRRKDLIIPSHIRVCSRHFKREDVKEPSTPKGRRLLKKGAVPTLFQWNNYSDPAPLQKRTGSTPEDEDPAPVVLYKHDSSSVPDLAAVDIALDRAAEWLTEHVFSHLFLQMFQIL